MAGEGGSRVVDEKLLQLGEVLESAVNAELERLEDPDELERIRRQRLDELKGAAAKQSEWKAKGHGTYEELATEKEFFSVAKGSERVVCHFFRNNRPCKFLDEHLAVLAQAHMETKFVRLNAESSPYLTERLKIRILPTLVLLKSGKVDDYVVGFDELGGKETFPTTVLEARLARAGVLDIKEDLPDRYPEASAVRQGGRF